MIKIGIRQNLFYPSMLITTTLFRQIDTIIIKRVIKFKNSILLTFIMFLSELISGLILFKRNINFLSKMKGKNKELEHMKIKLIQGESNKLEIPDSISKIFIYIFLIAFLDFIEFVIKTVYMPNYEEISSSLDTRLRSIVTISSCLFCYYLLKIPIYKHHKFSLLIIIICLILIIIIEYLEYLDKNMLHLTEGFLFIFPDHLFNSFKDVIEKYIFEYDYVNPFQTLMLEGLFGFIFTCFFSFIENPFKEIKDFCNEKEKIKIFELMICLLFYFLFSGGKNVYRVLTNKSYSPITKSLADSILDPFSMIYYCYIEDFRNKFHFIINLLLSSILVFCAFVYNEFFVLFCCELEENTYLEVSERASIKELYEINDEDNCSDD